VIHNRGVKLIIENSFHVIGLHLVMSFVLMIVAGLIWGSAWIWPEAGFEWSIRYILFQAAFVGGYTLIPLLLYFFIGRNSLSLADSRLINFFSVLPLAFVISAAIIVAFYFPDQLSVMGILAIPILPVSGALEHFFLIEIQWAIIIMSPLPSLAIWAGMLSRT